MTFLPTFLESQGGYGCESPLEESTSRITLRLLVSLLAFNLDGRKPHTTESCEPLGLKSPSVTENMNRTLGAGSQVRIRAQDHPWVFICLLYTGILLPSPSSLCSVNGSHVTFFSVGWGRLVVTVLFVQPPSPEL